MLAQTHERRARSHGNRQMTTNAAIEFLIWALIAASVIAVLAARLRISYTVALVLAGLVLGSVHLPILETLVSQKPGLADAQREPHRFSSSPAV
jgi:hypothetical protein